MKTSEIEAGRVYAGKTNRLRRVVFIWWKTDSLGWTWGTVYYRPLLSDVREGAKDSCLLKTFARWAVREVPDKER